MCGLDAMDVDPIPEPRPLAKGLGSDEDLAQDLDLSTSTGVWTFAWRWLEKRHPSPRRATFRSNRLEEHLDVSITGAFSDQLIENKINVLLAPSGAGKTRSILEFLYRNFGYYFVASADGGLGSNDMKLCMWHSLRHADDVRDCVSLVFVIRAAVCQYLQSKGFSTAADILLSQMYPKDVFDGLDVFHELFSKLVHIIIRGGLTVNGDVTCFDTVVIDEIQVSLKTDHKFTLTPGSTSKRPFFSPLIYFAATTLSHMCKKFIIAGTGIDYSTLKECISSATLKNSSLMIHHLRHLRPLDATGVSDYVKKVLAWNGCDLSECDKVVKKLSSFTLCHGRGRFVASILDTYFLNGRKLNSALLVFESRLRDITSASFPLRFLRDEVLQKSWSRSFGKKTLLGVACQILSSMIMGGRTKLALYDDTAEAVNFGIGFPVTDVESPRFIELEEEAVVYCLRFLVPIEEVITSIMENMSECPNPQMAGYFFEYFVSYFLVGWAMKRSGASEDRIKNVLRELQSWTGSISSFLEGNSSEQTISVCFPDSKCGPDIIYVYGGVVYIVQVKFVKGLYYKGRMDAVRTTIPDHFYTKKDDTSQVLEGYESERAKCLRALQQRTCQGVVIVQSQVNASAGFDGAIVISRSSMPKFFSRIIGTTQVPDMWKLLDDLQVSFS